MAILRWNLELIMKNNKKLWLVIVLVVTVAFFGNQYFGTFFGWLVGGVGVNVLQNGALGGNNNDTTAINALLAKGGTVTFPITNYTCGTLILTNNTVLDIRGATIKFLTASNGPLIQWGTCTNITLLYEGSVLDGTNYSDIAPRGNFVTNRIGIDAYAYSVGSSIVGNGTIKGFDCGIFFHGDKTTSTSHPAPKIQLIGGYNIYSNSVGAIFYSPTASTVVEYLKCIGWNVHENGWNVLVNAGNIDFTGCSLTDAGYAQVVLLGTGVNTAHGHFVSCSFNHNGAQTIAATNITSGEQIVGCHMRSSGNISLNGCTGVLIEGCDWDESGYFFCSGGGGCNYVINNTYFGQFLSGGNNQNFIFVNDTTTNCMHWGNASTTTPLDTDGFGGYSTNGNFVNAFAHMTNGIFTWTTNK